MTQRFRFLPIFLTGVVVAASTAAAAQAPAGQAPAAPARRSGSPDTAVWSRIDGQEHRDRFAVFRAPDLHRPRRRTGLNRPASRPLPSAHEPPVPEARHDHRRFLAAAERGHGTDADLPAGVQGVRPETRRGPASAAIPSG